MPIGYAHRGFAPDGGENSLAAFQAAVDLGYTHLETDARVTADGIAVAFHDATLDRVTNSTGTLARLSWKEVAPARIAGRHPIPPLADLLDAFPDCYFNIDVKSDAAVGPTLDVLRRTRSWARVRLASFSHRRLALLRAVAGPGVATTLSPGEVLALLAGRFRPPRQAIAAQVPAGWSRLALVDERFVDRAHALRVEVHVWTVNQPGEMRRLLDLGVDALISDRADVLRDVLAERGAWPK
ncbi:MAG TPA: glycerophosphodiester phosphodiesterase family protein [Jatrophihabitans sp.]|nr:glycerophosphodiester phosphodiesterase family protein [Jatrophihabitans sp.]